jgi:Lrp/AsnC family leucine-responsive transcriptional regulator
MLDKTSWKILQALQANARLSYAELARLVNLTAPAVAERVRKMEEAGVISGYHVEVNHAALGCGLTVLIKLVVPTERENRLVEFLQRRPEVLECYNITGQESFILMVALPSTARLNELLEALSKFGQPTTHLVLAKTIPRRMIGPDLDQPKTEARERGLDQETAVRP